MLFMKVSVDLKDCICANSLQTAYVAHINQEAWVCGFLVIFLFLFFFCDVVYICAALC